MTNEEIIAWVKKTQTLTSTGGQLSTENVNQFIDSVVEESEFLQRCRFERNIGTARTLDEIGLSTRLMHARTSEGSSSGLTAVAPTINRKTLTPKEVVIPWDISFDFLELNIERGNAEALINRMFAKQFANDTVDLAFNGDEDETGDAFLKLNDGFIELMEADSDVHDGSWSETEDFIATLGRMIKEMPNKWLRYRDSLRFFVSPANEDLYRDAILARNTALGDQALISKLPMYYKSIQLEVISPMPDTKIILTPYPNLAVGIGAGIRVGRQVQERAAIIEYTQTARLDFTHIIGDAVVLFAKE